jgi:hypothetical protein
MIKVEKTDQESSEEGEIGDVKEGRVLHAEGLAALETGLRYIEQQKEATSTEVLKRYCDFATKTPSQFERQTNVKVIFAP